MASNYHATVTANTQNYQANFGRAAAVNDAFVRSLRDVHQGASAIDGPIGNAANRVGVLQGMFRSSGAAMAGFSVALAAVGASLITHLVSRHGEAQKALHNMALMANTTTQAFEGYAFAVQSMGFESEQLADISKDVREKLGDFIASGGGEFADFFENVAPQIGLTANALQQLSGPDILIAVKQAMDQVNVSAEEQIFYLEAIASDASKLQPLLENNGAEFKRLAKRGQQLAGSLSAIEAENLLEAADHTKAFEQAFSSLTRQLSTIFAPAVSRTLATLVDGVLIARTVLSNLNNQELYDRKHFNELHEDLVNINAEIQSLHNGSTDDSLLDKFKSDAALSAEHTEKLNTLLSKRNELEQQMTEIQNRQIQQQKEQQALETAHQQLNQIPNKTPFSLSKAKASDQEAGMTQKRSANIDPFTGLEREGLARTDLSIEVEQLNTHNEAKKAIVGAQNAWYIQSVEDTENAITEIQYRALQARYGHMDFYQQNQLGLFLAGQKSIEGAGKSVLRSMIADQLKYYLTTTRGAGVASIAQAVASAPPPANFPAIAWATAKTVALNAAIGAVQTPSFEGGGYTGDAPRSGGIDGLGGFWALLHPQETVIDHTQLANTVHPITTFKMPIDSESLPQNNLRLQASNQPTVYQHTVEAPITVQLSDADDFEAAAERRFGR